MGEYDEKGSTVMAKELLDVKQLFVNVEDKEILHGVDLKIGKGETHVLMDQMVQVSHFRLCINGKSKISADKWRDLVSGKEDQRGAGR